MMIINKDMKCSRRELQNIPTHRVVELIAKKTLSFMTLWMISKRDLSGYEIIKAFGKEGMVIATASRMYPLLAQMEKAGIIRGKEKLKGRRKTKLYNITPKGREILSGASLWLRTGMRGRFFREMLRPGSK